MNEEDNNLDNPEDSPPESNFNQDGDFQQKYPLLSNQMNKASNRRNLQDTAKEKLSEARDQTGDFLKKKAVQAATQAVRSATVAAWSALAAAIGPYGAIILISLILIAMTAVPALALWNKARSGVLGNKPISETASASDVTTLLGKNYSLSSPASDWYLRQNDPKWADYQPFGFAHNLGSTGCVVTSFSMIAKYYGINIRPDEFAEMCKTKKTSAQDWDCLKDNVTELLAKKKVKKSWKKLHLSLDEIKAELEKGNPVFAYGNRAFSSSGPHAVVIVAVKNNTLILNDPMRGSGWHASWTEDQNKIRDLYVLEDD